MEAAERLRAVAGRRSVHTRLLSHPTLASASTSPSSARLYAKKAAGAPKAKEKKERNHWKSMENQRDFVLSIAPKLGLSNGDIEGWYKISNSQFKNQGGGTLLSMHNSSILTLLRAVFPERTWEEAKFRKHSRNFWKDLDNQKQYLEELSVKLGIEAGNLDAWYKVTNEMLTSQGGAGLLKHSTLSTALRAAYPDHAWDSSKFSKKNGKYWADVENQRKSLLEIGAKLGIAEGNLEGWYKVSVTDFRLHGGLSLLTLHDFSLIKILKHIFSDHIWDTKRFSRRPRQYWASTDNLRHFLDEIGLKLGIGPSEKEKWYQVTAAEVKKLGGSAILSAFNSSLLNVLKKAYPEVEWDDYLFHVKKPQNFWASTLNQRAILEKIGSSLGIGPGDLDKWYRVSSTQLLKSPAASPLLKYHNGSVSSMVMAAYPERDWEPWKFTRAKKPAPNPNLPFKANRA